MQKNHGDFENHHDFSHLSAKQSELLIYKVVKKLLSLLLVLLAFLVVSAATFTRQETGRNHQLEALAEEQRWVDSLFHAMTPDERLGQLIWLRAHTDLGSEHEAQLEKLILKYQPGGLCFFNPSFKGTPEKQVELTNRYQALASRIPLFMTIDGEWGLGMRYKENALSFPRQLMLGAIRDDKLIYHMGAEVAKHCKRVGLNVNFAPVADVNNNTANPVINFRSFGEDRYNVATKAYLYMMGMQDNGVMACAKHFPGHGDTDVDSHYDLPLIRHPISRLDSLELFPFKILIEQGVGSIMVAHLSIPALDRTPNLPTTLSHPTVTDLLKNKLGFTGLVMTDALEMKGVTKFHGKGEVEAKALAAGNDVLLLPGDVDAGFKTVKQWLNEGRLDTNRIHASVKKVLRWKHRMGLTAFSPLDTTNVRAEVNDNQAKAVKRLLIQNALTLVRNEGDLVPFRQIPRLGALAIGAPSGNVFHKTLARYAPLEAVTTGKDISAAESKNLLNKLKGKEAVVVSLHGMSQFASKGFGLTESTKTFIGELQKQVPVVLVIFGNPYSLKYFDGVGCILQAYEEDSEVEDLAAQALFGAFPIQGRLPVTATEKSKAGTGIIAPALQRLSYGLPEEVGMSSDKLRLIDGLAQEAIDAGATPGCVVLVAKAGKVVFEKAYGRHTYVTDAPLTQTSDIFDLASITKIAASAVSLMKLQDEGKFSVRDPLEKHLPEFKGSNKEGIPFIDMLTHRARLTPWIKFYEKTISTSAKPLPAYYDKRQSGRFSLPVAKDLWLRADYPDSIWLAIRESPLEAAREYRYSDLGFYIAGEAVRRISGQSIEHYASEAFYQPLGLQSMTYRPYEKFSLSRIPPTEEDDYFRARRIQGYVHDMGAAMLNQATGHAGLFSTASDLAVLMQMLLNKGWYGGKQYLQPETIRFYTSRCSDCTRRGIAFDMFQKNERFEANLSGKASEETYGHLGFTGTAVWVDPQHDLIYIFLSNRTYPTMRNNKLGKMNTRVRVQDAVYEAIMKF
jgi:beta-glucosidase-like glycosyl hydrolase/CubicO group peptidase (beta-lactamase class C family)